MQTFVTNRNTSLAIGDSPVLPCNGGAVSFYAAGVFTTAVLHYSPTRAGVYVPVTTLSAAGLSAVNLPAGFLKLVLTGTVTGATVMIL